MKTNDKEKVEKVWKENEDLAEELACCYYGSLLKECKKHRAKDSKGNFGFNTFVEGIRLGLDITIPLADERTKKAIHKKIDIMIEQRVVDDCLKIVEENFKEFEAAFQKKQKTLENKKKKVST